MNVLRIVIALGFLATPTFAQMVDLPRLTWPTDTAAPVTKGCDAPTAIGASPHCGRN